MARRKEPRIPDAILDQLLAGTDLKTAFDPNGLLDDLKKALAEQVLNAEMDHHLAKADDGNVTTRGKSVVRGTGSIEKGPALQKFFAKRLHPSAHSGVVDLPYFNGEPKSLICTLPRS